jgi:hypothetical protein
MSVYITLDELKDNEHIDFDDDDILLQNLCDLVEELVLVEIEGSVIGEGTVEMALTPTTGTVQTAGTVALIGTTTNFLKFTVGETITVSGETVRTIATITDNTHLTVTVAFSTSSSGLSYVVSTKKLLIGTETNFTDFTVGDTIKVEGETLRTIDLITDDTHLTVSQSFSTLDNGLTYTMHPGIPSPIPRGLKQAMLLIAGHYYSVRESTVIGVNITKIPYGYEYLIAPYKNFTIA